MSLRRRFLSALVAFVAALLPLVAAGTAVHADGFCVVDPLVTLVTPAGNRVDVHVTVGAYGSQHIPALQAVRILHSETERARNGSTEVEISIVVPEDESGRFAHLATVSSGPNGTGTVHASKWGRAGKEVTLEFVLNVP